MTLIKRIELATVLDEIQKQDHPRIVLFFGERYLCRQAADDWQETLLKKRNGTIYSIDGDQEDSSETLAKLMSYSLLPGLQIYRVNDSRLFHSKNVSGSIWQKACKAFETQRFEQAARYIADMYHLASISPDDRQPLTQMTAEQWRTLFALEKPQDLGWTDALFEQIRQREISSSSAQDPAERYMESFAKGIPPDNILLLTAENVDKRKRIFGFIKKNGLIVDCSIADGGGAAAQRAQKAVLEEMMHKTLSSFNKTIEPGAVDIFFERVGFHPVAVVTETEKLALYSIEKSTITKDDLDCMVGRTREDALFELTDHFGKRNLGATLTTLSHLLQNGIHGLAILATMRNYISKLLIFKTMQLLPEPFYRKGMNAKYFQDNYLPRLQEKEEFKDMLKGHPYALFMSFSKAAEYNCTTLKLWLEQLLLAEYRLKGSGLSERMVLEQLIITLLRKSPGTERRC
jgi:DNA polymerase III subunit delta